MKTYSEKEMQELLIEFLDSIREYMRESKNNLYDDERESSEFVNIFLELKTLSKNVSKIDSVTAKSELEVINCDENNPF